MDDTTIGARVRAARAAAGLTLREFSARLGVSPATMSALENGKTGISAVRLQQIGTELDVSISELLRPRKSASVETRQRSNGSSVSRVGPGDWREYGPLAMSPVLAAALASIRQKGYHGCTVREIAERANLSVPGIYHHHRSKQEMLVALLELTMDDLLRRSVAARSEGHTPAARFALIIESVALFHANRPELGFLGATEMRSLLPHHRERIAGLRRDQQRMVDDEVDAAVADGTFETVHPREASRASITLCTSLPQWFHADGPDSAQDVAKLYVAFALELVGARSTR